MIFDCSLIVANEFDELVPHITGLKEMVILGESAPRVKRAADKAGVPCVDAADVADATKKAFDLANRDVALLSPANASWDMYPPLKRVGITLLQ